MHKHNLLDPHYSNLKGISYVVDNIAIFDHLNKMKASTKVKKGDIIEIQFGTKTVKAEVLDLRDTTKKEEAADLFRYL